MSSKSKVIQIIRSLCDELNITEEDLFNHSSKSSIKLEKQSSSNNQEKKFVSSTTTKEKSNEEDDDDFGSYNINEDYKSFLSRHPDIKENESKDYSKLENEVRNSIPTGTTLNQQQLTNEDEDLEVDASIVDDNFGVL